MLQDRPPPAVRLNVVVVGVLVLLLVGGVVGILKVGANGYYVLSPGQAPVVTAAATCRPVGGGSFSLPNGRPCVQLQLPSDRVHRRDGSIMMVDVYQGKPSPWQFLLYKLGLLDSLGNHAELIPNRAILGDTPASQLQCQDTQQADQATSAAPVAALRRLGYQVKEEDVGAQIGLVIPGSAAAAAGVECDDLVTALNGRAVRSATDLTGVLHGLSPGTEVRLAVTRQQGDGSTRNLTLTARLGVATARMLPRGQTPDPRRGFLGVATETRTAYDFPFPVRVQVGSIGGPSDGLALALGLIDALSRGNLTAGLHIAATGAIDDQGNVIPIGGARQKAVAVAHAGAQVFFVPQANYAAARSQSGTMRVFAVSTLDQALNDLKALGGQVPAPNAATATMAASG